MATINKRSESSRKIHLTSYSEIEEYKAYLVELIPSFLISLYPWFLGLESYRNLRVNSPFPLLILYHTSEYFFADNLRYGYEIDTIENCTKLVEDSIDIRINSLEGYFKKNGSVTVVDSVFTLNK